MTKPWYHLSNRDFGDNPIIKARQPICLYSTGNNKFLCVAPSIAQCLFAIPIHYLKKNIYVYRTYCQPDIKGQEFDAKISLESRFVNRDISFRKISKLDKDFLEILYFWLDEKSGVLENYFSIHNKMRQHYYQIKLEGIKRILRSNYNARE